MVRRFILPLAGIAVAALLSGCVAYAPGPVYGYGYGYPAYGYPTPYYGGVVVGGGWGGGWHEGWHGGWHHWH